MPIDIGIKGQGALVVGGSKGIGKSIALAFAREGANVAICARGVEDLKKTANEVNSVGFGGVLAVHANMTVHDDIRRFVSESVARFGRVDILVYCANIPGGGKFEDISDEAWRTHIDTKLLGCIRCVREVLPYMRKSGGGRIVIISGMAARLVRPTTIDNGPVCAALSNFGKQIAGELAPDKILINTIHPDSTNTSRRKYRIERTALKLNLTIGEVLEQDSKLPCGRDRRAFWNEST